MRLRDRVVVVTGSGRGIGREIARAQAGEGARLALLARTVADLEETAALVAEAGGVALPIAVDLAERVEVERAFAEIDRALGSVDLLINNAGVFHAIGPIWEVDPDVWWDDVRINLASTFLCCRAAVGGMLVRGRGRIVNLIGGGTSGSLPTGSGYAVSKTGIMRFTECLADSVRERGVVVLAMAPGLVHTAMTELQLTSSAGRRHLPGVAERFATGDHLPPTRAAQLTVEIATGRFDRLSGRAISAWDDFAALERDIDRILAGDGRLLRVHGLGPSLKPTD